jgi:hypothetical protein
MSLSASISGTAHDARRVYWWESLIHSDKHGTNVALIEAPVAMETASDESAALDCGYTKIDRN